MDFLLTTDKNYFKYMYVVMASVYANHDTSGELNFHIMHNNQLTEEDKSSVSKFASDYGQKVFFYEMDDNLYRIFPKSRPLPVSCFYILFAHKVLPENLERVLYLDIDVAVNGNLEDFYKLNFDDNFLIGSKEFFSAKDEPVNEFEKFEYIENLDIQTAARGGYVNTGVLLFNLTKFREENIDVEFYSKRIHGLKFTLMDQSIINVCFGKEIKILTTCKYNYRIPYSMFGYFNCDQRASRGLNGYTFYPVQAKIIHYCDHIGVKPWLLKVSDINFLNAESAFFEMIPESKAYCDIWWKYAAMLPRDMYEKLLAPAEQAAQIYNWVFRIINWNPYRFQNTLRIETLTAPTWLGRNNVSCGTNIDIYTVPKVYICDAATKTTIKNLPLDFTEKTSFRLTVKQLATTLGLVHILEADDTDATVWRRHSSDGGKTWGRWNKISPIQDFLSLCNSLQNKYLSLSNSLSFKIGRMITFIPRKLRNAIKRKK